MFWVTFLNGMVLILHKECHKILISKCRWLSACASWFTKDQEGHKTYWASGNRVLDTFSTIQYMTICCLCNANIIMLSAIWVELSNSRVAPSQVTKMSHRTPDPLHTRTWRIGHETTPKFVIPISIWGTLACLLTVKLEEYLASSLSLPCSSLSQKPLCPQFPWLFSHLRYSVCQIASQTN